MHAGRVSPGEGAWILRSGHGKRRQQMTHRCEWTIRPEIVGSGAEHRQRHSPSRLHRTAHICKGGRRSLKNMTPKRENDRSKLSAPKLWLETSATIRLGVPQTSVGDPFGRPSHGLGRDIGA